MKLSLKKLLSFALSLIILIFACQKLEVERIMVVKTKAVSDVLVTTASVKGEVVDLGEGMTDHGVYYSVTPNAQNGTKFSLGKPASRGEFTAQLTNLTMGSKYYTRAYGERKGDYVYGDEVSFTTIGQATLTSTSATSITPTTAIVGGDISVDGGSAVTDRGIYWRLATDADTLGTKLQVGTGTGEFSTTLSSLSPNTGYTFRAYATNVAGTKYGNKQPFTTTIATPTLTTSAITSITSTSATSGGNVTFDGGAPITARGVCWGLNLNPTTADSKSINGTGTGVFTSNLTDLSPGKTYHVRAYASNSAQTGYGEDLTLSTPTVLPTVTTSAVISITGTTAVSGGDVISDGGTSIIAKGVCWGTSINPSVTDSKTNDGTGSGSFISSITGLLPEVSYHVRAYATNSLGTSYGEDIVFTTNPPSLPTLTTNQISAISSYTATGGGNITFDGNSLITARGVCWSTITDPTTSNNKTIDGTGPGNFTSAITGLEPGVLYYVRAYAINVIGTQYGNETSFTTLTTKPSVITSEVTAITSNTASCGGEVITTGGNPVTARGVCWSITSEPTVMLATKTLDGSGLGAFTSNITGLAPGAIYYLRAYAISSSDTAYGLEKTFTSLALLPTVTTTDITNVLLPNATSGGNVTSNGGATVIERGVCWSTSPDPTISDSKTIDGGGNGSFTSTLINLQSASKYYVKAYAINSAGTGYGEEKSFTTGSAPTIITALTTGITGTTCTSGGEVTASGGTPVTVRGVCWSTTINPTTANNKTEDGSGTGAFTSSITGLAKGTKYYIRAYATNSAGTSFGDEKSFITRIEPTVVTSDVTNITSTSAFAGGVVTFDGNSYVYLRGICWSTNENPTTASNKIDCGSYEGAFSGSITGLTPNTIYYLRAFAINNEGTSYGAQKSFTTGITIPTISTAEISVLTASTASTGGTIRSDGGAPITAKGVCWSINQNPTLSDYQTYNGIGNESYTSSLTGLIPNKTYYVRAYATNSVGTNYGNEVSFATSGHPILTTSAITDITATNASGGGDISTDGGFAVVSRGLVWSTTPNPTITLNQGMSNDGSGIGVFTSSLVGLTYNTIYYVRAYATNSIGTGYGAEVSFTTSDGYPVLTTSSITNISASSASGGGDVTYDSGYPIISKGLAWSPFSNPRIETGYSISNGGGPGVFSNSLTGLTPNTKYYVRAYAANIVGTKYGNEVSFTTTSETLPAISTKAAFYITNTTASCGGSISTDLNSTIITRGVCWSTSPNPTVDLSSKTIDGEGTGTFTSLLTELTPNTNYYVRAYATTSIGTEYGLELMFKTLEEGIGIGKWYAGGIVFHIDESNQHGLVCSPLDQPKAPWGCIGSNISGADGIAVGTGLQNTLDILNECNTPGIAASICNDLELNGYNDWYLPSKDELLLIFINLKQRNIGSFGSFSEYWSSSENTADQAWLHNFAYESPVSRNKDINRSVRAVRTF